jgi:hypothetical protein
VQETTSLPTRTTAVLTAPKSVRGTRTTVRVKVSGAGTIRISGVGLRQTTVRAKKAGTFRVPVRLSAFGAAKQKRTGRWSTAATARFVPVSGAPVKARKSVIFTVAKNGAH